MENIFKTVQKSVKKVLTYHPLSGIIISEKGNKKNKGGNKMKKRFKVAVMNMNTWRVSTICTYAINTEHLKKMFEDGDRMVIVGVSEEVQR